MTVQRGEIYWIDFDPVRGNEIGGTRPALVVQQDVGNRFSPTTVVAAITRSVPEKPYPFVVVIEPGESGLRECSAVNCSQLFTIQQLGPGARLLPPKGSDEVRPIGRLGSRKMAQVDDALRYNLGLR
jgi:mRNA interferase MazF